MIAMKEKVSIFTPSPTSHFLNILDKNIIKVYYPPDTVTVDDNFDDEFQVYIHKKICTY